MEQETPKDLIIRQNNDLQLQAFEKSILNALDMHGLPADSIFIPVDERDVVFKNIGGVLIRVPSEKKPQSIYLSKFVAAVAAGLFDAALNYLWNETIFELRRRVAQYDLSYFYDNAIPNLEKRKKLDGLDDLEKIEDSVLIQGAWKLELISDLGFKHLDYIRYMRNWASAAHPNQNTITGLQLVSWLQTCITEVISLPLSGTATKVKQLLANIKSISISEIEAREIALSSLNLPQEQINNLVSGLFGIYTRPDTDTQSRQNIHQLLPLLWERVGESTRHELGANYGKYASIGDQERRNLSRAFLELVSAISYISNEYKVIELEDAIDNLLSAHREINNFYNEPPFAQALQRIVGVTGKVPSRVKKRYVLALVEVFLTNGNGVARNAEPVYRSLINLFDPDQALLSILSFNDDTISSRLQFSLCQNKYRELLQMLKINISLPAVHELIEDIEKFDGPFENLRYDSKMKRKVENLLKIIG